jgi:hypothetical protein
MQALKLSGAKSFRGVFWAYPIGRLTMNMVFFILETYIPQYFVEFSETSLEM